MQRSHPTRWHLRISRNVDIPVHRWLPKRHAKNTERCGCRTYAANGWKQSTTAGWQRPEATTPWWKWPASTWWQRCTAFNREIKFGSVFKCEPLCSYLLQPALIASPETTEISACPAPDGSLLARMNFSQLHATNFEIHISIDSSQASRN